MQFDVLIQEMRDQLTRLGFRELRTPAEVEAAFQAKGTALVAVNSVCGCAGGIARPAAALSLQHAVKPDHLLTVFAGQDKEATEKARSYFTGHPPSSPSFALLRDGQIVHMIPREEIERRDPHTVAAAIASAFDRFCSAPS